MPLFKPGPQIILPHRNGKGACDRKGTCRRRNDVYEASYSTAGRTGLVTRHIIKVGLACRTEHHRCQAYCQPQLATLAHKSYLPPYLQPGTGDGPLWAVTLVALLALRAV